MIDSRTLQFLTELAENNHKEWFTDHRKWYDESREDFLELCSEVLEELKLIQEDLLNTDARKCVLRINRDIRFSKDKSPYKSFFGAGFGPGGKSSGRVDFYMQIQPKGLSMLGAGMWQPTSENLGKFRQEIDYNPESLKDIIHNKTFKDYFPIAEGAKLKTKPRGYEINHIDIELLRYKELFFLRRYGDLDVTKRNFKDEMVKGCKILKPYQDYLNELFFDMVE